jgi:hypothetical protein
MKPSRSDLARNHEQREGNPLLLQDGKGVLVLTQICVVQRKEHTVRRRRRSLFKNVFQFRRTDKGRSVAFQRLNLSDEVFLINRVIVSPRDKEVREGLRNNAVIGEHETTASREIDSRCGLIRRATEG